MPFRLLVSAVGFPCGDPRLEGQSKVQQLYLARTRIHQDVLKLQEHPEKIIPCLGSVSCLDGGYDAGLSYHILGVHMRGQALHKTQDTSKQCLVDYA